VILHQAIWRYRSVREEYRKIIGEEEHKMTTFFYIFIGVLVVLFLIAVVLMTVNAAHIRNEGKKSNTITTPIPDSSQRNPHTRVDQDVPEHEPHSAR
jgi:hypothetical protein